MEDGAGRVFTAVALLVVTLCVAALAFVLGLARATRSVPSPRWPSHSPEQSIGGLLRSTSCGITHSIARTAPISSSAIGLGCGAVLADDWLLLLVYWGALALALYLLVGNRGCERIGQPPRSRSSSSADADALLMLGVVLVWIDTGTTSVTVAPGAGSELGSLGLVCFAVAAFAKAGALPLHGWLPPACREAPIPVAALLPAALDKILAAYLLLRVVAAFETGAVGNATLMLLGALGIVGAMLLALVQRDARDLLAWSTVGQVGYIVLGIGTGTAVGLAGALFHAINNAVFKTCLFLGAGGVEQQTGTTDLRRGGGLARRMPITFACCAVASLAIAGVPPLSGFASKWMIYQGVIETGRDGSPLWIACLVAAMLGSALTLATFLKLLHALFLRKATAHDGPIAAREVGVSMWGPMVVLAALCLVFGIFPHALPLPYLVFPSVGGPVELPGVWWAGAATAMILGAFLAGGGLYLVSVAGRIRRSETWIGGERLEETYIRGVARDEHRDVEVTGADFYDTVRDVRSLRAFYTAADAGRLDPAEWLRSGLDRLTAVLGRAHSGSLTRYLAWSLLGAVALLWAL